MELGRGSLEGKGIVLTGGAGELGSEVTVALLREGGRVVVTGRCEKRLATFVSEMQARLGIDDTRLSFTAMDGGDPVALARGVPEIVGRLGRIDVLINNAGSAGPRQRVGQIPLRRGLPTVRPDVDETLEEAFQSLLASAWLTTIAFKDHFAPAASIINVSTMFSRFPYFGRAAYVVPKAALNVLSRRMAYELGSDTRGIRVNTVLPGPIETNRIDRAFAAMDALMDAAAGTTKRTYTDMMALKNADGQGALLSKTSVAAVMTFLASGASAGLSAHEFEVTHGMRGPAEPHGEMPVDVSRFAAPGGLVIVFAATAHDATALSSPFRQQGAKVVLLLEAGAASARATTHTPDDEVLSIANFSPELPQDWAALQALILLNIGPEGGGERASSIMFVVGASDAPSPRVLLELEPSEVRDFIDAHYLRTMAIVDGVEAILRRDDALFPPSTVLFARPTSTATAALPDLVGAGLDALIRVWRHEAERSVELNQRRQAPVIQRVGVREVSRSQLPREPSPTSAERGTVPIQREA
jgi:malonyl-CoA reductase/3-hydroxypropionate dehydrogenase (NADP+)